MKSRSQPHVGAESKKVSVSWIREGVLRGDVVERPIRRT